VLQVKVLLLVTKVLLLMSVLVSQLSKLLFLYIACMQFPLMQYIHMLVPVIKVWILGAA